MCWSGKWCCKGNGWCRRVLTSGCNGGGLVDWKVLFCGEVDSGVCNVVIVEFGCVKDMSFWDSFPDVSSGVFNVTDVSFIKLVSVGALGVTPPDKGWEWGWDQRCHGESFGMSESLS